jgi:hypothetical protein
MSEVSSKKYLWQLRPFCEIESLVFPSRKCCHLKVSFLLFVLVVVLSFLLVSVCSSLGGHCKGDG